MTTTLRLLTALLLLLAAACGDATTAVGSGAPTSAAVDPDTPVSDGPPPGSAMCAPDTPDCVDTAVDPQPCPSDGCTGQPDVTYEEVEIVPTAGTPRPVRFESAEPSADGTQVVVRWWSGVPPCNALADVQVTEDDASITISLFEASEHPDDADVACIEIAQAKQHTIDLATPLGDRVILDGADSPVDEGY